MPDHTHMIFAPNPTGPLHVGNALCYWLTWREAQARRCKVCVRVCADKRTTAHDVAESFEANMRDMARVLDAPYDRLFWRSDREARYLEVMRLPELSVRTMLEPMHPANYILCGDEVAEDVLHGAHRPIIAVLWKAGQPNGHLCNAVDFMDFEVPFHIRGIENYWATGAEAAILRVLGREPPLYAHLPALITKEYKKISKRGGVAHYALASWVRQFRGHDEVRNALEELIFLPHGPRNWQSLRPAVKVQV